MSKILDIGFIAVTRGVHDVSLEFTPFHHWVISCIGRYRLCDWGDTGKDDCLRNSQAIEDGSRLLAVYDIPGGMCGMHDKIWIITEAVSASTSKREYTTVLFPAEY